MAVLKKVGLLSNKLLLRNTACINIIRKKHFDEYEYEEYMHSVKPLALKDMMPAPYPRTEEQRLKAAEKYGMHPDEYKPLPDDHTGAGDYPDMPWIGVEGKDPYYPWDFPAVRHNYGEPWHAECDIMGEDGFAFGVRTKYNYYKCSAALFGLIISCFILNEIVPTRAVPVMEKQYPNKGVHYTFEPAT